MAKMLVERAIMRIKSAGHDISDEYSSDRCIEFLNNSMQQVSSLLIAANYPNLVHEITVRNGDQVPPNFMKAAGTYPIKMTDGIAIIVDDDYPSVRFRYFATPKNIEQKTDFLPFDNDAINEVVVRGSILLALNENEYDLSQDKVLFDTLQQSIASAMG